MTGLQPLCGRGGVARAHGRIRSGNPCHIAHVTLEAGGDFADGIIAYEGRQLGAEVFLSFDKDAVTIAKSQRIDAASP